jgi:hypothetical protein
LFWVIQFYQMIQPDIVVGLIHVVQSMSLLVQGQEMEEVVEEVTMVEEEMGEVAAARFLLQ